MRLGIRPVRQLTMAFGLTGLALFLSCLNASYAQADATARPACDRENSAAADYFDCEGKRLHDAGQKLREEARQQLAQSNQLAQQCIEMPDSNEAENCYLLSSDLTIDAGFKHAEAVDMLQEAERMFARAADLRDGAP